MQNEESLRKGISKTSDDQALKRTQERSKKGREYENKVKETFSKFNFKPHKIPELLEDRKFKAFLFYSSNEDEKVVCWEGIPCGAEKAYIYNNRNQLMKNSGSKAQPRWRPLKQHGKIFNDGGVKITIDKYEGEFDGFYLLTEDFDIKALDCSILWPNNSTNTKLIEKGSYLFVEIKQGTVKEVFEQLIHNIPYLKAVLPDKEIWYIGLLSFKETRKDELDPTFYNFVNKNLDILEKVNTVVLMRNEDEIEKEFQLPQKKKEEKTKGPINCDLIEMKGISVIKSEMKELENTSIASQLQVMNVRVANIESQQQVMNVRVANIESQQQVMNVNVANIKSTLQEILSLLKPPESFLNQKQPRSNDDYDYFKK